MSASDDMSPTAVDNAAALFGLTMEAAWRDAAMMNFSTIAKAARLVMEFPLDDEADYAPVFRP